MATSIIFVVLISSTIIPIFGLKADYYWREYTGKIPSDAVPGGHDINGDNIYIGQAYVSGQGLIVSQININAKSVYAPIKGARHVERYIKILCGFSENFGWLSTNRTKLHLDMLNRQAVIGGHGDGLGSLYIGRISYEGGAQIGKVEPFNVGHSDFFWVDKYYKERVHGSYEVLIYQPKIERNSVQEVK